MLFNSVSYLLFFPVVFAAYWLSPQRFRIYLLLAASYLFYMSWLPVYGLLLLSLTLANYMIGLLLGRFRSHAKLIVVLGLTLNLGTLCYYKYTAFLVNTLRDTLAWLSPWLPVSASTLDLHAGSIILPLGISFFAFEFIHYLSDIYKGDKPIRNLTEFALFAAFFPSQIAGPIKRYQDFTKQLSKQIAFDMAQFHHGLALILQGLFKKVALSDNLSPLVSAAFQSHSALGTLDAWAATLAFALQIYFDFSGYTDMGRGSAMMLGFSLPDNFNLPYLASNLSDFWKRWHISLSTWLRDYLYIPLGGGRAGRVRKHCNLMTTMLLGGLWHGAAWHFVIWGGLHGLGLVVSHEYEALVKRSPLLSRFHLSPVGKVLSASLTFFVVLVGWIFFRAETHDKAVRLIEQLFRPAPSQAIVSMLAHSPLPVALSVYLIYALLSIKREHHTRMLDQIHRLIAPTPVRVAVYAGAFVAAVAFCPSRCEPFIYFQF